MRLCHDSATLGSSKGQVYSNPRWKNRSMQAKLHRCLARRAVAHGIAPKLPDKDGMLTFKRLSMRETDILYLRYDSIFTKSSANRVDGSFKFFMCRALRSMKKGTRHEASRSCSTGLYSSTNTTDGRYPMLFFDLRIPSLQLKQFHNFMGYTADWPQRKSKGLPR